MLFFKLKTEFVSTLSQHLEAPFAGQIRLFSCWPTWRRDLVHKKRHSKNSGQSWPAQVVLISYINCNGPFCIISKLATCWTMWYTNLTMSMSSLCWFPVPDDSSVDHTASHTRHLAHRRCNASIRFEPPKARQAGRGLTGTKLTLASRTIGFSASLLFDIADILVI